MQRAFSLQPYEVAQAQTLDQERQALFGRFGALTLEMEAVRAQLPSVEQRTRTMIQSFAQRIGVRNYSSARIDGANLICELPEEAPQPTPPPAVIEHAEVQRINGEPVKSR